MINNMHGAGGQPPVPTTTGAAPTTPSAFGDVGRRKRARLAAMGQKSSMPGSPAGGGGFAPPPAFESVKPTGGFSQTLAFDRGVTPNGSPHTKPGLQPPFAHGPISAGHTAGRFGMPGGTPGPSPIGTSPLISSAVGAYGMPGGVPGPQPVSENPITTASNIYNAPMPVDNNISQFGGQQVMPQSQPSYPTMMPPPPSQIGEFQTTPVGYQQPMPMDVAPQEPYGGGGALPPGTAGFNPDAMDIYSSGGGFGMPGGVPGPTQYPGQQMFGGFGGQVPMNPTPAMAPMNLSAFGAAGARPYGSWWGGR